MTATGFGRSGNGGQPGRWGSGGGRQAAPGRGGGGRGGMGPGGGGAAGGADEAAAEALRLVAEFPRPQRLYVLFLEAADSHRLNAHLIRRAGAAAWLGGVVVSGCLTVCGAVITQP